MLTCRCLIGLLMLGWGQEPPLPSAAPAPTPVALTADAITLRDGKVCLGQVIESDHRGPLIVIVRRAWAEAHLADRAAAWEKAEAATTRQAEHLRHDRLVAWRRTRPTPPDPADPITPWLDAEIARLVAATAPSKPDDQGGGGPKSPLMVVRFQRPSVRSLDRKPRATGRLLRLAWTLRMTDPETMPLADLNQAIEDRGFAATSDNPASIDALLPTPLETDEQWVVRRAATELAHLPGGRFLLYGGAVLPEPAAGAAPPAGAALEALTSTLQELLGEEKKNPLPARFRELTNQGRVGSVVTGLEMSPDMTAATVTTTLWVDPGNGRAWVPEVTRSSTARPGDLAPDAGAHLAEDPQVKAALGVVSALGLGDLAPDLKQRGLNMGFATQKALNDARSALAADLNGFALPLDLPGNPAPRPKP